MAQSEPHHAQISIGISSLRCSAGFVTSDGRAFTLESAQGQVGSCDYAWTSRRIDDGVEVRLRLENLSFDAVFLRRIDILRMQFAGVVARARMTGFQSWSLATSLTAIGDWMRERPIEPPMLRPAIGDEDGVVVPWMTIVEVDGNLILIGAVECKHHVTTVTLGIDENVCASAQLEDHVLQSGECVESDAVWIIHGVDEAALLDRYANEVARRMHARVPTAPVTGWCSWYSAYTAISEADVLRQLAWLKENRAWCPLKMVQIDHGYETVIGDWLSPTERFPRGLRFVADAIREAGFVAGLWVSPFMVGETSSVAREHPEWLLRDHSGAPVLAVQAWGNNYALDVSQPEVLAWLRHVFRTVAFDWGFEYLKLDFLYAGCMPGVRKVSSMEAYRAALSAIREEVGDCFLLGCGAPLLPSVGLVDAMRVSPDAGSEWVSPDGQRTSPARLNAIRSNLAHAWMHARWWTNDPDCLLDLRGGLSANPEGLLDVRAGALSANPDGLIDVRAGALPADRAVVAMSGGMVVLGDDLSTLDAREVARWLPPSGVAASAVGPVNEGLPSTLVWQRGDMFVVAMFNWTDIATEMTFKPLNDNSYHLFDCWTGEHFGPLQGTAPIGVCEGRCARVLRYVDDRGRPQVVGSTLHILGGALEISDERWDGDTLTVSLTLPGRHDGEVAVYFPDVGLIRFTVTLNESLTLVCPPPRRT